MKSLQKKIAVFITCLSTCIVSSGISVFAQENKLDRRIPKLPLVHHQELKVL